MPIFWILSCNQDDEIPNAHKTLYFKTFDIFKLKGQDTLKRKTGDELVKVAYDVNSFPIYIKYYMPKRTVTLVLQDSFTVSSTKPIYCYTTSNLYGGKPGKHRVYSFHYEEYQDILYVSLSDTLVCQTENVPKDANFSFDLFIREGPEKIHRTSKGEFDYDKENSSLSKAQLYLKWFDLLKQKYSSDTGKPIIVKRLPEY